jgi:hypothetical protein
MTTSRILEGDLKLNPTTMAVLANLRQAKAEIDDLYAAIAGGTGVTQEALEALDVVQHNSTTGGLEVGGTDITVTNTSYDTVAAMNAATPATGTVALLNPAAFTGTGKITAPLAMIYTGSRWEPVGGTAKLFKCQFGTLATPTMVASSAARFALAADPIIPGGLLSADGDSLSVLARYHRHGTAGAIVIRNWLGTSATHTDNSFLVNYSHPATDALHSTYITEAVRTTATTLFSTGFGGFHSAPTASLFAEKDTLINFAADQYLTFAVQTLTSADTMDLLEIEVSWKTGVLV